MEAMQLGEGHRIVTIASGGCNMLAYLTRSPAPIDAVDLNAAHIALNRLKLAAIRHLPVACRPVPLLRRARQPPQRCGLRPVHRAPSRSSTRAAIGNAAAGAGERRIAVFDSNFYRTGLLGLFIAAGHRVARLLRRRSGRHHGGAGTLANSAASSRRSWRRCSTAVPDPLDHVAQSLAVRPRHSAGAVRFADHRPATARWPSVLSARLEKLACHFPLKDNYFAWQAFARRYPAARRRRPARLSRRAQLPATIRDNVDRVDDPPSPISPSCSPASRPAASTASSCSTRRTG